MSADDCQKDGGLVVLQSKDGKVFKISRKVAEMNIMIKNALFDDEDDVPTVPLQIGSRELKKVIEYCEHHLNNEADEIERPLKGRLMDCVSKWDLDFIPDNLLDTASLLMASNFLNNDPLHDLLCASVSTIVKGKSPEAIREFFGLVDDISSEE